MSYTHYLSLSLYIYIYIYIILAMELILRGAANTSKGMMKNELLTLLSSRHFMDDITIPVPSKIATDGLLQSHYDLFKWVRMKAKPKKKSRSLSSVRGSVREIHFKFRGDTMPKVKQKPITSLGRFYSIPSS